MPDLEKKVGFRIKQIRKAARITQSRLAEETRLSSEYISRVERGVAMPSFKTLEAIATVLGVREKDFFDFGGPVMSGYTKLEDAKRKQYLDYISAGLETMEYRDLRILHKIVRLLAED